MAAAEVAIVVLNWNGAEDTEACLESLARSSVPVHVILVDNGSDGDDVARLSASGLVGTMIEAGENLGYAGGNNLGLKRALDDGFPIIGVLNNDTTVDEAAVESLVRHLPEVGDRQIALSPDIRYFDDPTRSWFAGGIIDHGWPRHLQPDEVRAAPHSDLRETECLTGCCIVARAETWLRVGLFDTRYFVLFEDSEWSARAASRGVSLCVLPGATITHKVSQSFKSVPTSLLGYFYFVRNGLLFEWTYARRYLPRFLGCWLLRPTVSRMIRGGRHRGLTFGWIGALAFVVRQEGRAPQRVERLARRSG